MILCTPTFAADLLRAAVLWYLFSAIDIRPEECFFPERRNERLHQTRRSLVPSSTHCFTCRRSLTDGHPAVPVMKCRYSPGSLGCHATDWRSTGDFRQIPSRPITRPAQVTTCPPRKTYLHGRRKSSRNPASSSVKMPSNFEIC